MINDEIDFIWAIADPVDTYRSSANARAATMPSHYNSPSFTSEPNKSRLKFVLFEFTVTLVCETILKKKSVFYGPEYKLLSFTRISIVYNGIIPIISSNCIFNYESKPSISVHISLRSFTKIAFLMANNLLWLD